MAPETPARRSPHAAREIAASLEDGIAAGTLAPGSRLPTVRGLAVELGVSTATVQAAYRSLADRGLVTGRGRGGTCVARPRQVPLPRLPFEPPSGVVDLASGGPDDGLLPDLRRALTAVHDDLAASGGRSRGYRDASTHPGLAGSLAAWASAEGAPSPQDGRPVLAVSGVLDGVQRLLASHTRPGDGVVVEDPVHSAVIDLVQVMGLEPLPVPVDAHGMRADRLQALLTRPPRGQARPVAVLLTCRAHNPTGAGLTAGRAQALAEAVAAAPEVLLVETDPWGPVAGTALHSVAGLGTARRWAHLQGLSAVLGPDLRLAGLAADPVTAARLRRMLHSGAGWVPWLMQALAHHQLSDPAHGQHVVQAAATYTLRRESLVDALSRRGVPTAAGHGPHVWIPVTREPQVAQALLAGGIAVQAGETFRLRSGPGVRVTTSRLDPAGAEHVAAVIASACAAWLPDRVDDAASTAGA